MVYELFIQLQQQSATQYSAISGVQTQLHSYKLPSELARARSLRRKAVESYDTLRSSMAFFYFILVKIYFRHLVKTNF